jgi:carbonic anhydrase
MVMIASLLSNASSAAPSISPDEAMSRLVSGNARAVADARIHPNASASRLVETASGGQRPFATILSCSDSRVPPELIFDAGYGDLFVIRVAGNVADTDEIGSVEYGAGHLGTPVIVVLGHTSCGAVTAVVGGDEVGGSIPELVAEIAEAAIDAKAELPSSPKAEVVARAIELNVRNSMRDLLSNSREIAELVREKKVKLVGALYHLDSGEIDWLGEHPDQAMILAQAHGSAEAAAYETQGHATEATLPSAQGQAMAQAWSWILCAVGLAVCICRYALLFARPTRIARIKAKARLTVASISASLETAACVAAVVMGQGSIAVLIAVGAVVCCIACVGALQARSFAITVREAIEKARA